MEKSVSAHLTFHRSAPLGRVAPSVGMTLPAARGHGDATSQSVGKWPPIAAAVFCHCRLHLTPLCPQPNLSRLSETLFWTRVSSPDEKLSCDPEPRSGERYIAWGVSPRIRAKKKKAAERRQQCGADAIGSRRSTNLSPPPGACGLFAVPTLGLTPQAKNMPLLRSSSSGVNLFQDETASSIQHPGSRIEYRESSIEYRESQPLRCATLLRQIGWGVQMPRLRLPVLACALLLALTVSAE